MANFVLEAGSTLSSAGSLFVVASGLTLVFGAMRVINLAHGSFYMYGAFITSTVVGVTTGVRFWFALVLAALTVAVLGVIVELGVVRWVTRRDPLTQLVSTFAVFLILSDLGLRIWGTAFRSVPTPLVVARSVSVGGSVLPMYDFVIVGVALLVGLGLWILLRHTVLGWKIRAAVDDYQLLEAGGVNLRFLNLGVFALGALLAGLGGAIVTPQISVAPGIDASIIVSAFLVAVIGGLGSVLGSALGALVIGAADTVGTLVAPTWAATFMYVAVIVVLAARPWGLLGTAER